MPRRMKEGWLWQKGSRQGNRGANERGGNHEEEGEGVFWHTRGPR